MIDILIDDDGKVSIKTTKGIIETEIASTIVVEAMRNLRVQNAADVKSSLVIMWCDPDRKLHATKEIKDKLNLGLKEAKDIIDECAMGKITVLSKGTESEMSTLCGKFDPSIVKVKVIDD